MTEYNVQLKDMTNNSLYPQTKSKVVINNAGENLGAVEAGAQVNKIETITVNGVQLNIVSKKVEIEVPSYTMVKAGTATDGFLATYNLQKDGVNIGAAINIPKDLVVESGSVKTVETPNKPVQGYQVGDKYIDLVLAVSGKHIYILVSDLVGQYEAGENIIISGSTISVNTNGLKNTFATKTELNNKADKSAIPTKLSQLDNDKGFLTEHQDISGKADKATTLAGYGIIDGITYDILA